MTRSLTEVAADADRHRWNTDFDWSPRAGRGIEGPLEEAQLAAFDRDGFVMVPAVFDPARLDAVVEEIAPHDREVNEVLRTLPDGRFEVAAADRLTVTLHPSTLSEVCRSLAYDAWFGRLCRQLLEGPARLYWDQAVYKHAGYDEPVPWHQDNGYAYVEPQAYVTCWIPLADATADNGAIWVVPGAHRRGTLAHWSTPTGWRCLPESVDGAVLVEAPRGSVVVFSSLTPHRTGPNTTDSMRPAYICQYAPDGARLLEGDVARPPVRRRLLDESGRQDLVPT